MGWEGLDTHGGEASVQAEMEAAGYKWRDVVRLAQNRTRWRSVVGGLCTTSLPQAYKQKQATVMKY